MEESIIPWEVEARHPVNCQQYAIYTPPIDEMIQTIGNWIDQKTTGGYIYGPSRFGKSRALQWHVKDVLEERFTKKLPFIVWNRADGKKSEREFWNVLLAATKFHFTLGEKAHNKIQARYLFMEQLITLARSSRQNFIILMIDEAHDVTLNEWKWLLGLQNDLDYEGYRLTVFSVGSHQIGYQPNYLARTGNAHIAARFFAVSMRFHGIRNVDELRYVLNGYDVDSEWPKGSGVSFLKHFAASDFEQNRRLGDHAQDLWQAFENLLPKEFIRVGGEKAGRTELPMKHISLTIERLLHQLGNGDYWDKALAPHNLEKIIIDTGFTQFVKIVSAPE